MSVYTKRGDKGFTSVLTKRRKEKRVRKDSNVIEAIGSVDELNTFIGVVVSLSKDKKLIERLTQVQTNLFTIGSIIAGSGLSFGKAETKKIEEQIDKIDQTLPPIKNFTLPRGSLVGAHLHQARSVSRRAERNFVKVVKSLNIPNAVSIYLNRLSDYFFILARLENKKSKKREIIWKGP